VHKRNLAVVFLLVLVLGALAWWQVDSEQRHVPAPAARVLLPDVAPESIVAVRLDNLERSLQMRVERRSDGWWIVDPLEYPFAAPLVPPLFDALLATPSEPVDMPLEGLGFDPPRAVLTVEIEGPAGPASRRVELGAVDLDAQHVFARVDGALMRTLRNLETLLDRPLTEWRSRALLDVAPTEVLSFERRGRVTLPGMSEELDLDLVLELGERWRASEPFTAELAPEYVGPLLSSLCFLQAAGFEDDTPGPLEHYGLEPPDLRVELATARGERFALRFAFVPGREALRVKREDRPQIFTVARESVAPLFLPAEALVDLELLRAPRERLQAFELRRAGRRVRFERAGFGWVLSSDGEPPLERVRADDAAVDALVAAIEKARVAQVLPGREHTFEAGDLHASFEVDGEPRGWSLGAAIEGAQGTRGRAFRRDGDTLLGIVADDLSQLVELDPDDLVSRELHRARETELVQARAAAPWADARRQWERSPEGRWSPADSTAEAHDFVPLVDRLLVQRALRPASPQETSAGVRPIEVVLLDAGAQAEAAFTLSLRPDEPNPAAPAEVWYRSAERSAVVEGSLYADLARLLGL
jgi:hypothetical protein